MRVEIPDSVWRAAVTLDAAEPVGWDATPTGKVSLDASDASVLLRVPSVIVPEEQNVLINPTHADMPSITASKVRRWHYDSRM